MDTWPHPGKFQNWPIHKIMEANSGYFLYMAENSKNPQTKEDAKLVLKQLASQDDPKTPQVRSSDGRMLRAIALLVATQMNPQDPWGRLDRIAEYIKTGTRPVYPMLSEKLSEGKTEEKNPFLSELDENADLL